MSEYRPVVSAGQADERQLQLLMKDWRSGRATKSILSILTDGYVTTFSILVIGAMIVSGVLSIQKSTAGCDTAGCLTARGLTPWMMLLGVALIAAATARLFGPVVASAAEGSWLLSGPIRRSRFLAGRLWGLLTFGFVLGAGFGLAAALLSGQSLASAAAWSVATGFGASAVTALAAATQVSGARIISVIQGVLVVLLITLLGSVVLIARGLLVVSEPHWLVVIALAIGLAVITVIGSFIAYRRLEDLDRYDLVSGGMLVESVQGAAFILDLNLMRDILVGRRWRAIGSVRPNRGRGRGSGALIWREVLRLKRNPRNLILLGVSALVPYTLAALGLGNLAPTIIAIVLFVAMVPLLDGLRMITRSKGLERCFPLTKSDVRESTFFVAIVLTIFWVFVTVPAFLALESDQASWISLIYGMTTASVTGLTGVLAAIRWVTARPADYSAPMVSTAAGAVPPGLMVNLFKGFDIIALGTLPLVLGANPGISMVILIIAYAILRSGGYNLKELNEQAEDAKRELAEIKEREAKEKKRQVVARGASTKPGAPRAGGSSSGSQNYVKKDRSKPRGRNESTT